MGIIFLLFSVVPTTLAFCTDDCMQSSKTLVDFKADQDVRSAVPVVAEAEFDTGSDNGLLFDGLQSATPATSLCMSLR